MDCTFQQTTIYRLALLQMTELEDAENQGAVLSLPAAVHIAPANTAAVSQAAPAAFFLLPYRKILVMQLNWR